jgi:predicted transcriptional regulator
MTKDQIDAVLLRVQSWPRPRQEDAARLLLAMEAQDTEAYALSDAERAEIETALREADAGDVATDTEVAALFARYRG